MSIDMSQFHAVFIEESHEHLDNIERSLMDLDVDSPSLDELNSIFRAAHSIKGGSGIFGFDALISVTHVMENLFDNARQGKFRFSRLVIDELLAAVDALRTLLGSYSHGDSPDMALVDEFSERIGALLNEDQAAMPADEGFGFFTEPVKPAEDDESFGFFTDEPPAEKNDSDEGFGFFDAEPVAETGQSEASAKDDEGFGFFETVATDGPAVQPESDPVAAPAVGVPPAHQNTPVNKPAASDVSKKPLPESGRQPRADAAETSSIRVDIGKVDSLVNLAGELVITQSMLNLLGAEIEGPVAERLQTALAELERNTRELQESIMSIRMLPLSFVFNRFPRVVRDLSQKLNKNVELVIDGGQTEIDKGLIEKLVDPLTHLVRNSLDHGIETPARRREVGKPETGYLTLKAEQKGGNILISVIDDGAGLNRDKILRKAAEKGIELPEYPTDDQVWQLIMAPGFSTADAITDVSGRGVGMDVVKRNIESLGGRIEIESSAGEGSVFQIRLPLTLAILDGMSVSVADQLFIIPLVNIVESVQPEAWQLKQIGNKQMLELREAYWPIVKLCDVMTVPDARHKTEESILVLVETSRSRYALQVDDLIGQQQVVIKSLEQHYRRVHGVAGATIMGDGSVALILDVESLSSGTSEGMLLKDVI